MPKIVRPPSEPTDDWHQLQLHLKWPEQKRYELLEYHVPPPPWQPPKQRGRRSKQLQELIERWAV